MRFLKVLSVVLFSLMVFDLTAQTDSLQFYYQKSIEAHDAGDYPIFLEAAAAADRIRPNHPTLTYNLAAAHSLNQQPEKALKHLRSFILMNSTVDFSQDKDFAPILQEKGMADLLEIQRTLTDSIRHSYPAFELNTGDFHPECLTYSKASATFYLGGVHQPGVMAYHLKKKKGEYVIDSHAFEKLYCVLGIAVDDQKNSLWLVSTVLPQMKGYDEKMEGWSSIYEIDLKSKKVLTHIYLEADSRLGELRFHKGTAYVADGLTNKIYSLKSGDTQLKEVADLSKSARNLQGMALSDKEDHLFISDYVSGIFKVNIQDGTYSKLQIPDNIPFKGIDGLLFYNRSLLAIQNGSQPMRVMRLFLDPKEEAVIKWSLIDQNRPYLSEPTQGVIIKDTFYFIANSPWAAYDQEMLFQPDQAVPTMVRKIKLEDD